MTIRHSGVAELAERSLEDVLREVAERKEILTVHFPDGEDVVIQPAPKLKPLHVLEGYVPDGWREAIYERYE
jgi:hypothetical protein